jgi:CDP-diacylglycerol--glycerol-3-phosphate 3-phosphatidyltransferase
MADPAQTDFWNVPNSLTMSRLALAVVVFALISYQFYTWALVVFAIASLTDTLDGYFARRLGQTSAIGRQLDPLVDKVLVCGAFVYLLTVPESGLMPSMVTVIIIRELLVQAMRSLIEGRGEPFGAMMAGKLKTTLQCLSISGILLALALRPPAPWLYARDALTWGAVLLTIYSGFGYLVIAWPRIRGDSRPSVPQNPPGTPA